MGSESTGEGDVSDLLGASSDRCGLDKLVASRLWELMGALKTVQDVGHTWSSEVPVSLPLG